MRELRQDLKEKLLPDVTKGKCKLLPDVTKDKYKLLSDITKDKYKLLPNVTKAKYELMSDFNKVRREFESEIAEDLKESWEVLEVVRRLEERVERMESIGKKEERLLQEKVSKAPVMQDMRKYQEDVCRVKAGLQDNLDMLCRERAGLAAQLREKRVLEARHIRLAERSQAISELDTLLGENKELRKQLKEAEVQVAGGKKKLKEYGKVLRNGIKTLVMAREGLGLVVQEKEMLRRKLDEKLVEEGRERGDKGRRNQMLAKRE